MARNTNTLRKEHPVTQFPLSVLRPLAPLLPGASASDRSQRAQALVDTYRLAGHLIARIDPLSPEGLNNVPPELDPAHYGLSNKQEELGCTTDFAGGHEHSSIAGLLKLLRLTYCGSIGLDCAHIREANRRTWLFRRMEIGRAWLLTVDEQHRILQDLIAAEELERLLAERYPATKRFSLEGCDALVPLINALCIAAAARGAREIVMGMPHRGRLNVLANCTGMRLSQLLSLFGGAPDAALDAWDLKYHLGCTTRISTPQGHVGLFLAHNPSHLESVSPVVCGMVRALQDQLGDRARKQVCPVLVHGDAAIAGQGIVMETLTLSQTTGYTTGGTIHVIVNNQLGFTANAAQGRSSLYCSDIARMIDAPVWHVNADDPEAVVVATRMAVDFRYKYGSDVVIDLMGYRRHGHNEQDDARLTQPQMQAAIDSHPRVTVLYANHLVQRNRLTAQRRIELEEAVVARSGSSGTTHEAFAHRAPATRSDAGWEAPVLTSVPSKRLRKAIDKLTCVPSGFAVHPALRRMLDRWACVADENDAIDWSLAENLAYASLLSNGHHVRVSGMDVGRGTFWHRMAVWHHQTDQLSDEQTYVPLCHIDDEQGEFAIHNSPLSEEAVLGFEYGYSTRVRNGLVIWEAQYGDFVNNAQTIIDAYVATGEFKWGYASGLVMLLPHGHEGVGPEHSSAFLGRFLSLCADRNLCIVVPTTSAQLFHALRRQALLDVRKPLIVFTPKSSLRALAHSHTRLRDFAHEGFRTLIFDHSPADLSQTKRVVLVAGKLYYDLRAEISPVRQTTLLLRIEQLYPFPTSQLAHELARMPHLREVVWAQEEAKNHGAWHFVRDALDAALPRGVVLRYVGRDAAAAAATCRPDTHESEQRTLVSRALGLGHSEAPVPSLR